MTNEANNAKDIIYNNINNNEYENRNDKEDNKPKPNETYDIVVDDSESLNEL